MPRSAFTESVFLWRRLSQQVLDEVVPAFAHPERSLTESVAAVREDVHVEVLVRIHQLLDHHEGVVRRHIGVQSTVSDQQLAFQVLDDQLVGLVVIVGGAVFIFDQKTLPLFAPVVLYLLYSILLSLHLELSIVVGLYVFVSDYQAMFMSPNIIDVLDVLICMYLVVFAALSLHTARKWQSASAQKLILQEALEERDPDPEATITLRVDRQQIPIRLVDIRYVESQRDYLLVHTRGGRLLTKQTLSSLESELHDHGFLRIHRSSLIRTKAVTAWSAEQVSIGSDGLPIGRSYRTDVRRSHEHS